MTTLLMDPGGSIYASPDDSGRGLALFTTVCPGARCSRLHMEATEAAIGDSIDVAKLPPEASLLFTLDTATGQFSGGEPKAEAYLASAQGAWLPSWIERNAERLDLRFTLLDGQQAGEPPDTRPAPRWAPGERIFHRELYPYDFTPTLQDGRDVWFIDDACCPDPGCDCSDVSLSFFKGDDERIEVAGRLGERRPEKADARGRALWTALHANPKVVETLEERREDIRFAGPFVVAAAYEQRRLAACSHHPPSAGDDEGGYLRGGAIPLALVERLFDVGGRFHARRTELEDISYLWFRVEVRGALHREGWGTLLVEGGFSLFEELDSELPWLELEVVDRDGLSLQHRRQRIAHGLPLLGATALPVVRRMSADESLHHPEADELRLALAIGEAFLAATHELVPEAVRAPRVFEHRVELDTGVIEVALTASHADDPWNPEEDDTGDTPDEDDSEDDAYEEEEEEDLEDDGVSSGDTLVEAALEAFTDAALDGGLSPLVLRAARTFIQGLGTYAAEQSGSDRWFSERNVAYFLEHYGPRKVLFGDADIEQAKPALHAIAKWLGEVGHSSTKSLLSTIDRALPTFRARARDRRFFSMAKGVFSDMRSANIDINDQGAIDRFLAAQNAEPVDVEPPRGRAPIERSPTRWKPAPGERAPAPAEPCGCGSGKRYKKCCMPR